VIVDRDRWQLSVHAKGVEREPVVIIDHFLTDPTALIDEAAALSFTPMAEYYPGVRAPAAPTTRTAVVESLLPIFHEFFDVRDSVQVQALVYSLVTTAPAELTPIQRLPHYDGIEPGRLALVLYLGGDPSGQADPRGGTGFYRHRSTGYETVTTERFAAFSEALQRDVTHHGLPDPRYIVGDTPIYERIFGSPAVFNRALIYRGRNLHSADIPPQAQLDPHPRRGRLTLNGFLNGR
jgi:hypothetical protein